MCSHASVNSIIVSITPDLALDVGHTYAGGLGVLEGDKFYGAARLGLNYYVITLLYRNGYVDYEFDEHDNPMPKPQPQPKEFLDLLKRVDSFSIKLRGEDVEVHVWEYTLNTAHAIFIEPKNPEWAAKLVDRLYVESSIEERFLKYVLLARASVEFIRRIGIERISYIDLQESYAALVAVTLGVHNKCRLIIHTPGPWGHPSFPNVFFRSEYGYSLMDNPVVLTNLGAAAAREVIMVSEKHLSIMSMVMPHFMSKARYVTNGVDVMRWMDDELRRAYEKGSLDLDTLMAARNRLRRNLVIFLRARGSVKEDSMILGWVRRITAYKRPQFMIRLAEDLRGELTIVLGGKAHPMDNEGLTIMRRFRELSRRQSNVHYIHDYDVSTAKIVLRGIDVLAFTPFPGWEASGTSFMKSSINGVPTVASRDGAVIELIKDGVNGWLFGEDIRLLIDLNDPVALEINEKDYVEFRKRVEYVLDLFNNDRERFYQVALNAINTMVPRVNIERVLSEYYPGLVCPGAQGMLTR